MLVVLQGSVETLSRWSGKH